METIDPNFMPDGSSGSIGAGLRFPFTQPPATGDVLEVAAGVWWARLPSPTQVDHVNVYFLRDGDRLVLVDTGYAHEITRAALKMCMQHPTIEPFRLSRIVVTHFHPDHIGLAGEWCSQGVELWTTRTTWAFSRLLWQETERAPTAAEQVLLMAAGLSPLELVAQRYRRYPEYADVVTRPPDSFVPVLDDQELAIGERRWKVRLGFGHAPDLITLWSDDLAIVSDQIIPTMASNLSVAFTEPQADIVSEWLDSCTRLETAANDQIICLPGHQLPFQGAATRCQQLRQNSLRLIHRVQDLYAKPRTARECLEEIYRRSMNIHECRTYVLEVMGILNHLHRKGLVEKQPHPSGKLYWQRTRTTYENVR